MDIEDKFDVLILFLEEFLLIFDSQNQHLYQPQKKKNMIRVDSGQICIKNYNKIVVLTSKLSNYKAYKYQKVAKQRISNNKNILDGVIAYLISGNILLTSLFTSK